MSTRTKTHQLITDPLIRIFALGASNRQDTESLELTQPNESGKLFSARLCKGNFSDLTIYDDTELPTTRRRMYFVTPIHGVTHSEQLIMFK